jgi:Tfp pilus assembly protein PilO
MIASEIVVSIVLLFVLIGAAWFLYWAHEYEKRELSKYRKKETRNNKLKRRSHFSYSFNRTGFSHEVFRSSPVVFGFF